MSAIVVAIVVGLVAVGLVSALVVFSALTVAGLKAINVAHEGGTWLTDRIRRHRAG